MFFRQRLKDEIAALSAKLRASEDAVAQLRNENAALQAQLARARSLAGETRADVVQLLAKLAGQTDDLPPPHLQIRQVGGVWGAKFYPSGRTILDHLAAAFREAGQPLESAGRILDFGCGVGRVLWNFQSFPHSGEIWGSDIDAESIAWDESHLGSFAKFSCNPHQPPTAFADGMFDAIYSISVFTHLPEDMQFAWLAELHRILKPGGVLAASFHGAHYWRNVEPGVTAEVEARGFAYRQGPPTDGLPDFYMVAYHSQDYIRSRWSEHFDIVDLKAAYIHGVHDLAVLRKK